MKSKTIKNVVVMFFASFFLFVSLESSLLTILSSNKRWIANVILKSDYVVHKHEETLDDFNILLRKNGFQEPLFNDILTQEVVRNNTINYLNNVIKGENLNYHTSEFRSELKSEVEDYIQKHNIYKNKKLQQELASFYNTASKQYVESMSVPYFKEIISVLDLTNYHSRNIAIFSMIGAIMMITILLKLNKKRIIEKFSVIFTSIFMMISVLPTILLVTKNYENLGIFPRSFKQFIVNSIDSFLGFHLVLAFIILIIIFIFGLAKKIVIDKDQS